MTSTYKIAITGPESVGKSWMAKELAEHYNTNHSYEFARKYLENNNVECDKQRIEYFAKEQIALEENLLSKANNYLFCDTDLINFKIWLNYEGYEIPNWLEHHLQNSSYTFNLLLDIDLPWERDPLRMYPNKRAYFFSRFETELNHYNYPYQIVKGIGKERKRNAISAIHDFFNNYY